MEGLSLSETKEETAHIVITGDVEALTTLGYFVCTKRKWRMMIKLDQLALWVGTARK